MFVKHTTNTWCSNSTEDFKIIIPIFAVLFMWNHRNLTRYYPVIILKYTVVIRMKRRWPRKMNYSAHILRRLVRVSCASVCAIDAESTINMHICMLTYCACLHVRAHHTHVYTSSSYVHSYIYISQTVLFWHALIHHDAICDILLTCAMRPMHRVGFATTQNLKGSSTLACTMCMCMDYVCMCNIWYAFV